MSIRIRKEACTGCGRCAEICPGNLIWLSGERKAYIKRPEECWGCTSCLKECRAGAVDFFLGADIGGRGSTLSYQENDGVSVWKVSSADGREQTIVVDKKESNKY